MKIVLAIDSLKGSLSSLQAGEAASCGIKKVFPDAKTYVRPIADGGEGTVDALTNGLGGVEQKVSVTGPLGKPVLAKYGIVNSDTAVIEMAEAAGITLVCNNERNPLYTTTYGVGEIITDAINNGCRKFIIGIGGSATNDGGIGMLQVLGFEFQDANGKPVPFGAIGLSVLSLIKTENVMPELSECEFNIACDVKNPLCGDNGCSAVYGPQKGADESMIKDMDKWLLSYYETVKKLYPDADKEYPGSGAAGGIGFAFMTFLNAKLLPGIDLVLKETSLEDYIKDSDIVITGEGRLDSQTVMGKAPIGVAAIAKKYGKSVIAFSGCVTKDAVVCNKYGIDAFFPIVRGACSLEEAMNTENAYQNMTDTAEQVFRVIKAYKNI